MEVIEAKTDKKQYLPLLLEADPPEEMIDRCLGEGAVYAMRGAEPVCVAVVLPLSETECELKNIVVARKYRGQGYGGRMLSYLANLWGAGYSRMLVGTCDTNPARAFMKKRIQLFPYGAGFRH